MKIPETYKMVESVWFNLINMIFLHEEARLYRKKIRIKYKFIDVKVQYRHRGGWLSNDFAQTVVAEFTPRWGGGPEVLVEYEDIQRRVERLQDKRRDTSEEDKAIKAMIAMKMKINNPHVMRFPR